MAGTRADPPEDRVELLRLYDIAVAEYRFQINLNWDCAKYLLGFSTALITLGTGLIRLGGSSGQELVAGVFLVGFFASVLSCFALSIQHDYYRAARDRMVDLGDRLGLANGGVRTTPSARGRRSGLVQRLGKVQTILFTLLAVCMVVEVAGIGFALG